MSACCWTMRTARPCSMASVPRTVPTCRTKSGCGKRSWHPPLAHRRREPDAWPPQLGPVTLELRLDRIEDIVSLQLFRFSVLHWHYMAEMTQKKALETPRIGKECRCCPK